MMKDAFQKYAPRVVGAVAAACVMYGVFDKYSTMHAAEQRAAHEDLVRKATPAWVKDGYGSPFRIK